jgi:hypothetical protein
MPVSGQGGGRIDIIGYSDVQQRAFLLLLLQWITTKLAGKRNYFDGGNLNSYPDENTPYCSLVIAIHCSPCPSSTVADCA